MLEIADNLELEADKLQEEADAKRQKAAYLRSELEMLGKPAGNGDK